MSIELPEPVNDYITSKVTANGEGGRPHFLADISTQRNPEDVLLDIAEWRWVKSKSISYIAKKLGTSYHTIYRLLEDIDQHKQELVELLETTQRRKTFWNRDLHSSDYETVQRYIDRALADELKSYKAILRFGKRVWKALGYKDPARWTRKEIVAFIKTLSDGTQINYVNAVRRIAPQTRQSSSPDYISVSLYREKIKKRKKPLFGQDVQLIHEAIDEELTEWHKTIFDLHITLGAREGSRNPKSGITGITWDRFKKGFTKVDEWESKVRSRGIYWRNCPVNLFFKDLPARLRKVWTERGKPTSDNILTGGYKELLQIYKDIRKACKKYWKGKVDPNLLKEMSTLRPHDSDKIHCNLCWEAKIPLEVVAGQHLGGSEGIGLVGRGWLSVDTIKKYYLSLSQRTDAYQEMLDKVTEYSSQFNGAD